ncbi:type II toxin-antitoxin system RelE/ParE family toxin [Luteimonas sp. MJ293]|uniref:type II toxin-antitoxin system RelE/ParE family toxin n=1 Tax=Luteimonas sp. MJ146 TaxID=3129240 RepID=UPI0031BBA7EE
MNQPLHQADAGARPRDERPLSWTAGLLSGSLHLAILLLAMLAEPMEMPTPQGSAAGGSRVEVVMIGETPETAPPTDVPPVSAPAVETPQPPRPDPVAPAPAPPRVQPTPVVQADEAMQRRQAAPAAASPPPTPSTNRRAHVWGQPPGMLAEDHAPVNAGRAPSPAVSQGRRHTSSSSEPSMEVGGYQVLYDVRSEQRLRDWRDAGITELFIPLPGTRDYMVCPLEVALRRESGACRLLDPDDPEMADIGDAREVINMHRVYRRGELVWRGPRAYR